MSALVVKGISHFYARAFSEAMRCFSMALAHDPNLAPARIGVLLCDMAGESEEQAVALFEYYLLSKESGVEDCEGVMEQIIHSVDENRDKIAHLLKTDRFEDRLNAENGIRYEDFILLVHERGSFKAVFQDIMFSTKVIISSKEHFVDFLSQLMENGFVEMSLNYLESAVTQFPNDEQLLKLIKTVKVAP